MSVTANHAMTALAATTLTATAFTAAAVTTAEPTGRFVSAQGVEPTAYRAPVSLALRQPAACAATFRVALTAMTTAVTVPEALAAGRLGFAAATSEGVTMLEIAADVRTLNWCARL
jgi:hypothetical protein